MHTPHTHPPHKPMGRLFLPLPESSGVRPKTGHCGAFPSFRLCYCIILWSCNYIPRFTDFPWFEARHICKMLWGQTMGEVHLINMFFSYQFISVIAFGCIKIHDVLFYSILLLLFYSVLVMQSWSTCSCSVQSYWSVIILKDNITTLLLEFCFGGKNTVCSVHRVWSVGVE